MAGNERRAGSKEISNQAAKAIASLDQYEAHLLEHPVFKSASDVDQMLTKLLADADACTEQSRADPQNPKHHIALLVAHCAMFGFMQTASKAFARRLGAN